MAIDMQKQGRLPIHIGTVFFILVGIDDTANVRDRYRDIVAQKRHGCFADLVEATVLGHSADDGFLVVDIDVACGGVGA